MERTDELHKIIEIYVDHEPATNPIAKEGSDGNGKEKGKVSKPSLPPMSNVVLLALQIYEGIFQNEDLVKQIERYAAMKEFSNDPTKNITQLSQLFEQTIQQIQLKNQKLKIFIDQSNNSNNSSSQILQHYRLIQQYLSKAITNQVTSFKQALKEHAKHVEERNKRIEKYGNTSIASSSSSTSAGVTSFAAHNNPIIQQSSAAQYAMFNAPNNTVIPPPPTMPSSGGPGPASLTHRRGGRSGTAVTHTNNAQFQSQSQNQPYYPLPGGNSTQHVQIRKDDQRLKQAEKAEATIKQMGHLFTQMATLISEQSEVIMRIEDDVEAGYSNTIDGYKSLENVYEITKGNRSMILKIFAILIFFIFLFLVWT